MGSQGSVIIDAGASWVDEVTVAVAQASVASGSLVEAWIFPGAGTTDHTADEHRVDPIKAVAHSVSAGVGFSISVSCLNGPIYGKWNVAWCWN